MNCQYHNPFTCTVPQKIYGPERVMIHRSRITDESVLSRWMGIEINRMNEGIVHQRKFLSELLNANSPAARTRKGEPHNFKKNSIKLLGEKLPGDMHSRLKDLILFIASPDVPDSCSCADETALKALQILGEVSELRTMHENTFWVARSIVYAILQKYPTAVQVVIGI